MGSDDGLNLLTIKLIGVCAGVPCVVLRDVTERQEGVELGIAKLTPLSVEDIVREVSAVLDASPDTSLRSGRGSSSMPSLAAAKKYAKVYGDGNAVLRSSCLIVERLGLDVFSCEGAAMREWLFEPPPPLLARSVVADEEAEAAAIATMQSFSLGESASKLFHRHFKPGSITVILTQFRRNTTEAQLRAVLAQTAVAKIDAIIIYQNEAHVSLSFVRRAYGRMCAEFNVKIPLQIVHSIDRNLKFHGRFTLPLLVDSEYTAVFDDDTVPQPGWIAHAITACKDHNAIVGAVGMIVGRDAQYFFVAPLEYPLEVDYVGHSWVFRSEWARHLWAEYVPSWDCCEDIGFSASAWLRARIRTVLPAMPKDRRDLWGDSVQTYHKDGKQSFTKKVPAMTRWPVTRYRAYCGFVSILLCLVAFPPSTKNFQNPALTLYAMCVDTGLSGGGFLPRCETRWLKHREFLVETFPILMASASPR